MIFLQVFNSLYGKRIIVELVNGQRIEGTLQSSDHFFNIKLVDINVLADGGTPEIKALSTALLNTRSIVLIELPKDEVDLKILHDSARLQFQS